MALNRVAGLWRPRDRTGKVVASGPCGQTSRWIVLRSEKRGENDPDFVLMIGDADRETKPTGRGPGSDDF